MLRELVIENFVLIDRVEVLFVPGFTVVTGDTGAGKTLLIKAFKVLLGARGQSRFVGGNGRHASIQAVFEAGSGVRRFLRERGIECGEELILRRIISSDGKNRVFINGVISTIADLRSLSLNLMSLAGQHEFQKLLRQDIHRSWLDGFACISTKGLGSILSEVRCLRNRLESLVEKQAELEERREGLERDAGVIDGINPRIDEEDRLVEERRVLRQSEKMRVLGQELFQRLYGDRDSILEGLSACRRLIGKLSSIDQSLESLCSQIESVISETDDIASSIRDYLYNLPMDDSRLHQVEERLFQLRGLKKRFGPGVEDVLEYRDRIDVELSMMENLEGQVREVERILFQKERDLIAKALEISGRRKEAAILFQEKVQAQLGDLGLGKARFQVQVESPREPSVKAIGERGMDRVTFLFSANPGQGLKPLTEVASGGELSRLLLAIKVVLGTMQGSETMVFDEIDSGLGGEVAEKVGRKLLAISETAQVIAISHFPQIAALAHSHVVVRKEQGESQTTSEIFRVEGSERVVEIARMLGGESGKAREYAKELLGPVFRRP